MTQTLITLRQGLPEDMRLLMGDYPREAWPDHPNFARSIQNWMGAHGMFRQLAKVNRVETEKFLDKACDAAEYAGRLSYYGDLMVRNLHGHHTWEDRSFFPELSSADQRFDHGLDMLESDHEVLDESLDRITRLGNRVVQLAQLDEVQALEEAGALHRAFCEIEGYLARHLSDEEDLVIPIVLHHKLRG